MRRAGAAAGALLLAGMATAQTAEDALPPLPGLGPDPAGAVEPPRTPERSRPVAPATGGPSLVLNGIALEGNTAVPESELAPILADLVGQRSPSTR